MRVRALQLLAFAASALSAGAGEGELRLDVLRSEAHGSALDVLLRIEAPEGIEAELGAENFTVYIAPAELAPAEAAAARFRVRRIFLKRLGNAYYIDLRQLPPGVGGRALQLIVQATSGGRLLAARRLAAFLGTPPDALDVALVIDESLSMLRTDPEWLRLAAAKAFVDHARQSTRIGHIALVAFNDRCRTLVPLTPVSQPEPLYQAIQRISAMGQTDMDAALAEAQKLLERSPSPNKVAILLSDGKDEPGAYENAHRAWAERRWPVYTIGLSKLADAETLQRIASDTGGDYHCSPTNAELRDIFNKISVTLHNKVAIRSRTLRLQANVPAEDPLLVDETVSALTLSLGTAEPGVSFAVLDSANRLLTPELPKEDRTAAYNRKADSQHYDLWGPAPGRCVARIAAPRAIEVRTSASAATPLLLRAFPLKPAYLRGEPIEAAASLALADEPLAGARIEARVLYPGAAAWRTLPLYDDGQHSDTAAGDGVFAAVLPAAEQAGLCQVHLAASGTTPAGHPFEREAYLTATIRPEGYHRLAAAPQQLDFGLLYCGESAERAIRIELIAALPTTEPETVSLSVVRADASLPRADLPREVVLKPGQPMDISVALHVAPGQPAGRYSAALEIAARYDRLALPIAVEVRQPKLVLDKPAVDLGAVESGGTAEGILELRLEPRGAVPARLAASDQRLTLTPAAAQLGPKPLTVRLAIPSRPEQASEAVRAKLVVETPIGAAELPVVARIVKPSFTVAPVAIDFGEASPGQTLERQLALCLEALAPRQATFTPMPLAGPGGIPPLTLDPIESLKLAPGEPVAVSLRVKVPALQPPGGYRGELVVRTPLGDRTVSCTISIRAAKTFEVAAAADFGSVAVGTAKQLEVELASLVDAEQRLEVRVAEMPRDLQMAAEPATVTLPPRGRAAVTLRLVALADAKPGPRTATVGFRGPSRGAQLEARALIFRPPHDSIAFFPAELHVGRLQAGIPERFTVQVKSLVSEAQEVAIERADAPAHLASVRIEPARFSLNPLSDHALELTVEPAFGPDEDPFEAAVVARGRSLPATLRIRGTVFTPPRTTFVLAEPLLDFGPMTPGQRAELALAIQSVHHREQRVSLAEPPSAEGISLAAERGGALLLPGVMHPIGIELAVAPDATPGERLLAWEVRGPGDPATFDVRVEVVPRQAPAFGTPIATAKPGPLGWLEGALLFLLLCVLLAILVASYLLARRLLRSTRVPWMARFFAVSALLHVAALFVTLDLFLAHKVRKQELGPLFRVGLKAAASGGGLPTRQASAADELRAQQESERRLEAERRAQEAARLARELLESERRKLDPALARLEKPQAEERPNLAPKAPDAKRLTVEDLAQIVEELRDPARAKEAPRPDAQAPAPVEPERLAQLRALSREQLESVVREALQPQAASLQKTATQPGMPDLSGPRATDKAAIAPEELVPAIEALKHELTRAEDAGGASLPRAAAAGDVQAQRATSAPAADRGSSPAMPSAERGMWGGPLASPHPALRTPHSALPTPLSPPSGAGGPRHAAPIPQETPEEVVAVAQGAGQREPQPSGPPAPGAFARAAPARPGGEPSAQRASAGQASVARVAEARGEAAASRQAAASAATPPVPPAIPGPPAQRRPAPVSFPTPDEQPAADPLVQLPGTPQAGDKAPQPRAVAIARADASGGGGQRAETPPGGAAVPRGPDARDPAHAPVGRSGRPLLPELPAGGTRERAEKVPVPFSADVELVEGPLVAARQDAPRGRGEAGPQAAVAAWHLRLRAPAGERLAMAAGAGSAASAAAPRAVAAERPVGGPAAELAHATPAPARGDAPRAAAPATEAALDEAVELAPRTGVPGGRPRDVPGPLAIEGGREASAAQVERAAPSAGTQGGRVELEGPSAGLPPVTRHASRVAPPALAPLASGGRQAAPLEPDATFDEPVEAGPRTAARVGGGPEPLSPRGAAPEPPRFSAAVSRLPAPIENHQSKIENAAAVAALAAAGRGLPSRLLLPGLATGGEAAGALVGEAAGAVKSIVLSTVKYGADWDCHRTAMPFLAWQLRERVGFNLETDVVDVPLASNKVMNAPWVFMTGHKDFRLTEAEVANLRLYLLAGGTLWAEDCTHEDDPTWDRAFRREIARVLPPAEGYKLRKIAKDDEHPLFRACFDLSDGYKGYWPPPGDKYRQSYIEGIELAGRLAVIYTRNDYGCGLEIKPDTHPGKVSLSSLSPAEMQEASFLMASNIIVYALTGGRGLADRGLAGRAAASLRRQREAAQAQGDPYEKAQPVLFESFADDNWLVETTWDGAGAATLRPLRRADPRAEGRRLAVNFQLAKGQAKVVLIRDLAGEADLSGHERCYIEVESRLEGGARLAIALITMPDWRYFESRPAFIKPGRQRVWFDLRAPTWKTGEPVAEGESEYCRRPANLDAVRRCVILLYPVQPAGTVLLDQIEFRSLRP